MPIKDDKAKEIVESIAREMGFSRKVTRVSYRQDYQDYQVVLDENFHCEIREKLIQTYLTKQDGDAKREIKFQLQHAKEFEEWEKDEPPPKKEDKMVIDDKEKYDFI